MKTIEILQEVFRDLFDDEELVISEDMALGDLEEWDSFMNMALISEVEAQYNIRFTVADMERMTSVAAILETIDGKVAGN